MAMVVIDVLDAPAQLEGVLSRRLFEVRPGVFVGALSKRALEVTWAAIEEYRPRAALLVYPARTETGIAMRSFGEHQYRVIDNFGLQLIEVATARRKDK